MCPSPCREIERGRRQQEQQRAERRPAHLPQRRGSHQAHGGEEGFEVHLFADESRFPQLANPVQMQFDTKGRLWVAAWADYPKWEPLKESKDMLLILHDDDNDGKADRVTEFAKVNDPLGFEFLERRRTRHAAVGDPVSQRHRRR